MTTSPTHDLVILLDDARHACEHLAPLTEQLQGRSCILVACAPRMTHRVSKWVSHTARENWRHKWAAKQFAVIEPWLQERGLHTEPLLAKGPVSELLERLNPRRLIDARRPRQHSGPRSPTSAERFETRRHEAAPAPGLPGVRRRGPAFG